MNVKPNGREQGEVLRQEDEKDLDDLFLRIASGFVGGTAISFGASFLASEDVTPKEIIEPALFGSTAALFNVAVQDLSGRSSDFFDGPELGPEEEIVLGTLGGVAASHTFFLLVGEGTGKMFGFTALGSMAAGLSSLAGSRLFFPEDRSQLVAQDRE